MKKIIYVLATVITMGASMASVSCSDILEVGSDNQVFDPDVEQKTDSIYYILGIMKSLQQAIDQYVIANEVRGDLVGVGENTTTAIKDMAYFQTDVTNKYDSAYVYYRIINNCNYYIEHRDTTLMSSSRYVAMQEYAQAKIIRAWTYLQLAKIYGRVPFFTHSLTNISDGNAITNNAESYRDIKGMCYELASDLMQYVDIGVPNYGTINAYRTNAGQNKDVASRMMMFPARLVIADLYFEAGNYPLAAKYYFEYIQKNRLVLRNCGLNYNYYTAQYGGRYSIADLLAGEEEDYPEDLFVNGTIETGAGGGWNNNFNMNNPAECITYVPMAVNKLEGTVSDLSRLFGYNLFYSAELGNGRYIEDHELDASQAYLDLASSQDYYCIYNGENGRIGLKLKIGDMRRYASLDRQTSEADENADPEEETAISNYFTMNKYYGANVFIYRTTVVYLRLAECLNRMGYPEVAFAFLKDGPSLNAYSSTVYNDSTYMRSESLAMLSDTSQVAPFYHPINFATFENSSAIHSRGCGYTKDRYSLYQYQKVLNKKAAQLNETYGLSLPDSIEPYSDMAIEIMEDVLCDEYALECAFEGHRFGDLCRMARAKNEAANKPMGANWGSIWLGRKLALAKGEEYGPAVEQKILAGDWYLPFK